jgi:hypothetical protein
LGGSSDVAKDLSVAAPLLKRKVTRRMLRLTGNAVLGVLLAGCGFGGFRGVAQTQPLRAKRTKPGWVRAVGTRGVVFNTASQDVTLFNPASNEVTGSQPTNAVVRWLSNEQNYWDGGSIWTGENRDAALRVR